MSLLIHFTYKHTAPSQPLDMGPNLTSSPTFLKEENKLFVHRMRVTHYQTAENNAQALYYVWVLISTFLDSDRAITKTFSLSSLTLLLSAKFFALVSLFCHLLSSDIPIELITK